MIMLRAIVKFYKHPDRRPIWQIIMLLPCWLMYSVARKYLEWFDERI